MAGKVNPLISMVAANQANYPCQARSLPLGTLISPYVGRLRRTRERRAGLCCGSPDERPSSETANACVPLWPSHTDDGGHIWGEPSS
jgi:hypothetical protein